MKKMLMVATVPSMIGQFNMNNIQVLQEMGYEVHVACDFTDRSVWTEEKVKTFENILKEKKVKKYQIDFSRNAWKVNRHIRSYKQLKKVVKKNQYNFIHCHTPIAGAVSRMVCRSTKTKCIYTAHGFHFFKGASLKNWLLFYPIEWICSWMTDVLITINKEDYERAKRHLHAKKIKYVPGVGIDVDKYKNTIINKEEYLAEFNLLQDAFIILSVGELNKNKNHAVVIKALAELRNPKIHYLIAGKGELKQELEQLSAKLGIKENIHLLGYRKDVAELYKLADLYILPSLREGLNVSLMEAMTSGLPCIVSNIRGNRDLITNSKVKFDAKSVEELKIKINIFIHEKTLRKKLILENFRKIENFTSAICKKKMSKLYQELNEE